MVNPSLSKRVLQHLPGKTYEPFIKLDRIIKLLRQLNSKIEKNQSQIIMLWFFKNIVFFINFILCVSVFLASKQVHYMCYLVPEEVRIGVRSPWNLELETFVGCHVDAEKGTNVLCKNNKCS